MFFWVIWSSNGKTERNSYQFHFIIRQVWVNRDFYYCSRYSRSWYLLYDFVKIVMHNNCPAMSAMGDLKMKITTMVLIMIFCFITNYLEAMVGFLYFFAFLVFSIYSWVYVLVFKFIVVMRRQHVVFYERFFALSFIFLLFKGNPT